MIGDERAELERLRGEQQRERAESSRHEKLNFRQEGMQFPDCWAWVWASNRWRRR